jgi:hypothetical protein
MQCRAWLFALLLSASWAPLQAQDADSLLLNELDSMLQSSDSLSILNLIDSLLNSDDETDSQVAVRLAYNSNVLSTGRTLGIDQFGLSPGISYFHKTGLYADASIFYSDDFNPNVYLTVLSVGYMHSFGKRVSVIANYDRYLYNLGDAYFVPYTNSVNVSVYLEQKPITFRADYIFFFGAKNAHRIAPGINLNLEKRNIWGLHRIAFSPTFAALFGNETFEEITITSPTTLAELIQNYRDYGTWYRLDITQKDVFGVMNYAISCPVSISKGNWNFTASYTYNIPKALEGETLTLSETGFIAASLSYYIPLRKAK